MRKENGCFFVYGSVILNPDNNNLISINGEQNTSQKLLGQRCIFEKKKKKLEKTRQNKPKKANC